MRYLSAGILIAVGFFSFVSFYRLIKKPPPFLVEEPWKVRGRSDAPVSLIEFSDFSCPHCETIQPTLKKILADYPNDVKLIYKHFPIFGDDSPSRLAAEAAECAGDQGLFWDYHDLLYPGVDAWYHDEDRTAVQNGLIGLAQKLRMDIPSFSGCVESRRKMSVWQQNKEEGMNFFVSGTPTLLLNGKKVLTNMEYDYLRVQIDKELMKLGKK